MSLFRNNTIGFIVLFFLGSVAWGQTPPMICNTPPSGYIKGGAIGFDQPFTCKESNGDIKPLIMENKIDSDVLLNQILDYPVFYINVDNTTDISTGGFPAAANNKFSIDLPIGTHWILLKGEKAGQKYLTCKLHETLGTSAPKIEAKSCNANSITLNIPIDPDNKYDRYTINWGDGSSQIISSPLPFNKTITYIGTLPTPMIQGEYIRNSTRTCQSNFFPVIPDATNSPLIHTLEGTAGGKEAKILFFDPKPGQIFKIEGAVENENGLYNWTEMADGINGTANITGLNPNFKYCFRTKIKNSCNIDVFSVNTICTINLKANIKNSSTAVLTWNLPSQPNTAPVKLSLRKDQIGNASTSNNIPFANTSSTKYDDATLNCNYTYLYQLDAKYPSITYNNIDYPINIKSQQILVDPKANMVSVKPTDLVAVGFDPADDQKIRVNILVSDPDPINIKKYIFYRTENNNPDYIKKGTYTTNAFDDFDISTDPKSYCYKYQVEDQCGIISEMSDPFCTIMLNSQSEGILKWTPYLIPPDIYTSATPVNYTVEYFVNGFSNYIPYKTTKSLEQVVQDLLNEATQSEIKIRIVGNQNIDTPYGANQGIFSYSNPFTIKVPPGIYIPNAFSPNGDSKNETFKINLKFVSDGTYKIFDRWGGTVFEGLSLSDEWDGTQSNGLTPAPSGTYAYIINAIGESGQPFRMTGSVLLLR